MKTEMRSATKAFKAQKCDNKGCLLEQNIDKETRDGMKSLSEKQESVGHVPGSVKSGAYIIIGDGLLISEDYLCSWLGKNDLVRIYQILLI